MSAPNLLTPDLVAAICRRDLAKPEALFIAETILRDPERFRIAARAMAPDGFMSEAEVASWMLAAARSAGQSGSA